MTTSYHHTQTSPDNPEADVVVSRHMTSEGILTYFRTPDGHLRAQLRHWNGDNGIEAGHSDLTRCA